MERKPIRRSNLNEKVLAVVRRHDDLFGVSDPYYIAPPTCCSTSLCEDESTATVRSRSTTPSVISSVAAIARENARRKISQTQSQSISLSSPSLPPSPAIPFSSVSTDFRFTHPQQSPSTPMTNALMADSRFSMVNDHPNSSDLLSSPLPLTPSTFAHVPFVRNPDDEVCVPDVGNCRGDDGQSFQNEGDVSFEAQESNSKSDEMEIGSSESPKKNGAGVASGDGTSASVGDTVVLLSDSLTELEWTSIVRDVQSVSLGCRPAQPLYDTLIGNRGVSF